MSAPTMVGTRLSVMMFLQFFIWGSWYVTVGNFIGGIGWAQSVADATTGWAYTVGPIAAIVSPLFLGVVADRFFATQRVLALMHLLAGLAMFAAPYVASGPDSNPDLLIAVLAIHMLCYMPTLGLTNTLAFTHVTDQERQFPIIRMFGTIGWIVAGLLLGQLMSESADPAQFYVAGSGCVALAVFSLTLPHTPPPLAGQPARLGSIFGFDAIGMLKDTSFLVFIVSSFLICIPLAAYYQQSPIFVGAEFGYTEAEVPERMSLGQIAEVFFMLVMPLCFRALGIKKMIAIGMFAWVVRYGLFAGAADEGIRWMVLAGILLHGICYDFFFVTGQIYVDKAAPESIRGQAQGFLVLITQGFGLGIGAQLVAAHVTNTTDPATEARDWETFWFYPAVGAAVILVLFLLFFRERKHAVTLDAS